MGKIRDREEKKKRNHVFSSGVGGGTKGPAKVDKRNQELQCPHCERVFKQVQRLRDHVSKQHADSTDETVEKEPPQQSVPASAETIMDIGSRGGGWSSKSPRLLLLEWTQNQKRPKPRYKVLQRDDDKVGCKVVLPDPKDNQKDIVVFLDASEAAGTEDEAYQLGALAALHRVAGERALHRILPQDYLPVWERFGKEAEARQHRADCRAAAEEKRKHRENQRRASEAKKKPVQVVMSEAHRRFIKLAIGSSSSEGEHAGRAATSNLDSADTGHSYLTRLGFHKDDVDLAYQNVDPANAASLPELLDWLCLHLPEERLPASFAPAKAQPATLRPLHMDRSQPDSEAGSTDMASLTSFGYSPEDVADALSSCSHSEEEAFSKLYSGLLGRDAGHGCSPSDQWQEETVALEAIYGTDLVTVNACRRQLLCEDGRSVLDLRLAACGIYPFVPPLVALRSTSVPGPVILGATRLLAEMADGLTGSAMCLDLAMAVPDVLRRAAALEAQKCASQSQSGKSTEAENGHTPLGDGEAKETVRPPVVEAQPIPKAKSRLPGRLTKVEAQQESLRLRNAFEASKGRLGGLHQARQKLPAYQQRQEVLAKLKQHNVLVVSGATGCGKSTQIPQCLLEEAIEDGLGGFCNIVCTQPRRISAIGLANRVSQEKGEAVGGLVGYSVRLESKTSRRTRLLFCTTGVLLRRILSEGELEGVTHVIVDEVHERSTDSDLLLCLLKDLLARRGDSAAKVVLMSATSDAHSFSRYFSSGPKVSGKAATLDIPGRLHPVKDLYLEDALEITNFKIARTSRYAKRKLQQTPNPPAGTRAEESHAHGVSKSQEGRASAIVSSYCPQTLQSLALVDEAIINYDLIEALVCLIVGPNKGSVGGELLDAGCSSAAAILVFLPGVPEINRLVRTLQKSASLQESCQGKRLLILPLHGSLSPTQQAKVFQRPPADTQKIVISTNVAETSVTIDDVICVVDSGRMKEVRYDPARGLSRLEETWVSLAAAKQRRGRAGRAQPGVCIKLFSRQLAATLQEHQPPEVLRVPLQQLCLTVKATWPPGVDVGSALQGLLSPPPAASVSAAMDDLAALGAVGEHEVMTMLGRHLVKMPMDPKLGKALIYGALLRCLSPVLAIVAALAHGREVFVSPPDQREEARAAKLGLASSAAAAGKSDHIAIVAAFNTWHRALKSGGRKEALQVSKSLFLSEPAMEAILAGQGDFAAALADLGFVDSSFLSKLEDGSSEHWVDQFSANARMVKAALCAGFYPALLRVEHGVDVYSMTHGGAIPKDDSPSKLRFFDRVKGRVFMHSSSVLFDVGKFECPWLIYTDMIETSKVFCREASMVPVYSLLLFGGRISIDHEASLIKLDGWATFKAPASAAVLIKELRAEVDRLLLRKVEDPAFDLSGSRAVDAMHRLLASDGF